MTTVTESGVDVMKEFEHGLKEVFKCGKQMTGTKGTIYEYIINKNVSIIFVPPGIEIIDPSESLKILPS